MKKNGILRRWWRCTDGTTAIEFALVAPLAIFICLLVLETGRALLLRNELAYAVDLGARRVLLDPAIADQDVLDAIRSGLTVANRSRVAIETHDVSGSDGAYRMLVASTPFLPIVPYFQSGVISLSVRRSVPLI